MSWSGVDNSYDCLTTFSGFVKQSAGDGVMLFGGSTHAPALTHEPGEALSGDLEAVREAVPLPRLIGFHFGLRGFGCMLRVTSVGGSDMQWLPERRLQLILVSGLALLASGCSSPRQAVTVIPTAHTSQNA